MIGIDAKIETLRARFASKLFTDIAGNTYTSYGRAFINREEDGDVPELLIDSTNEYQEVLPNDNIDGHSFFVVRDEPEWLGGSYFRAEVSIYFAVKLRVLYPSITGRAVEYLHRDVTNQIRYSPFELQSYIQGLPAFDEFPRLKDADNMSDCYLVRFDTEIEFNQNC